MDASLLFELFAETPRQGPGNAASTSRAFAMLPSLGERPRILDVGCGSGAQTRDLAALNPGFIAAVDIHLPFLRTLKSSVTGATGTSGRIRPVAATMTSLPFQDGVFDLIWSEGAISIMGFAAGLRNWRRLLRPGGCLVVSEATWLRDDPPEELRDFWAAEYPAMATTAANLATAGAEGYEPLGNFVLPESAWVDDYYAPLEERLRRFRDEHAGSAGAEALVNETEREISIYRRFSAWYGYVIYVLRKGS